MYILIHPSFCVLNFMLSACRPKFAEFICTTYKQKLSEGGREGGALAYIVVKQSISTVFSASSQYSSPLLF
jgi:hypothetical protein